MLNNIPPFDYATLHKSLTEKAKNNIQTQIEEELKNSQGELVLIINSLCLNERWAVLGTPNYKFSLKYQVISAEKNEKYDIDFAPFIVCQPLHKFNGINPSRWKLHISLDQTNQENFYSSVNIVGNILIKNQIKFKIIRDSSINLLSANNQAGKQVTIYYGEAIDNVESLCRVINKSLMSNGIKPDPHHDGSIPSAQNGVDRFIPGSMYVSYRCEYIEWKSLSNDIKDKLRHTVMSMVKNDLAAYSYYMNAMINSNYLPAYCVNVINPNNFYNPLDLEDPLLNVSVLSDGATNSVQQKPLQIIEKLPETKSLEIPKPKNTKIIYQFKSHIDLTSSFSRTINDTDKFKSFFKIKKSIPQHKNKKPDETQSLSEKSQLSC